MGNEETVVIRSLLGLTTRNDKFLREIGIDMCVEYAQEIGLLWTARNLRFIRGIKISWNKTL